MSGESGKMVVCLKCQKTFEAKHEFNRICPRCNKINQGLRVHRTSRVVNVSGRLPETI